MTQEIIASFVQLGKEIKSLRNAPESTILYRAEAENRWFSLENLHFGLDGIAHLLQQEQLEKWLSAYQNTFPFPPKTPKKIGVIMAGNIPAVGFHDLLCVLMSGHILCAKLSSQDSVLIKTFAEMLEKIDHTLFQKIHFVERLNDLDAYIATGSDNSARYFQYYLGNKPNLIRQNRHSIAVLNGQEDRKALQALGNDIFMYFGLGCRNIKKIFVPKGYDFTPFFEANHLWDTVINNTKYANNYEYQRAVHLINLLPHFDNGFLLVRENTALASPLAVLHYEFYEDLADLHPKIQEHSDKLQLIASDNGWFEGSIPLGKAQLPDLWDYADGADTMAFLSEV